MKFLGKKNAGFSLVELMVVVAIIGILAALAVPRFATFQAKARQSEAKNNLSHMYTLQESFYGDNERYSAAGLTAGIGAILTAKTGATCGGNNIEVGFKLTPCSQDGKIRYRYVATVTNGGAGFTATATTGRNNFNRVFPRCPTADQFTIDQNRNLRPTSNASTACSSL